MFNFFKKAENKLSLNLACFTTKNVVSKKFPITRVYHFSDGNWQFSDDESSNSNENIMIVSLGQVLKIDKTIENLLSMSASHCAKHDKKTNTWTMSKFEEEGE